MRLPEGGRIDRGRPLRFRFDGTELVGCQGDTLASALLANGVRLVGRSFKYHRPRGLLAAGADEPNALVRLGSGARAEPNAKATQVELFDGLVAESQNRWPSLRRDAGRVLDLVGAVLPAGFYYKTFLWPASFWEAYERVIRTMAGMGRAPEGTDPDRYAHMHARCDVLVVGAGPAGLAAALAAGRAGARVILADEQPEPGGGLLAAAADLGIDGQPADGWLARALAELAALPEVRVLPRTTALGYHDHNHLTLLERVTDHLADPPPHLPRQRWWKVRAGRVVLATGATERPLVFPGNDRPGVMLAAAARTYARRWGVRPGRRAILFTNNSDAYEDYLALGEAGVELAGIVDLRGDVFDDAVARARGAGIRVHDGTAIVGTEGGLELTGVTIARLDSVGHALTRIRHNLDCDLLVMSGGWNPNVHLFSQSGGRLGFDDELACFVPGEAVQPVRCAGAAQGGFGLADALAGGWAAGAAAAADTGFSAGDAAGPVPDAVAPSDRAPLRQLWRIWPPDGDIVRGRAFVDFQNDVTAGDIALAAREGYRSVEHLKRYTTAGMGTDQGKTSNVNALGLLAEELGETPAGVGVTTFRPPYTPVTFGAMAGADRGPRFRPVRRTPMQDWHEQRGAVFEPVGLWQRPYCYPFADETADAAVRRETRAVRATGGVLDASTLGKIDIRGPDAGVLLDRLYCNRFSDLAVGRCRYGLMLDEQGMVFDDGVTARLAPDHWHMTTTSGGAAGVLEWIEDWLQTDWTDLRVWCTSVTEAWAVAALAGPHAGRVLAELAPGLAIDDLPFMGVAAAGVAGLPARVFWLSYTGEDGFEINVPADCGPALWQAVLAAGARWGVGPFGTEAMHVLRCEAGFIAVGDETDGTMTPIDLGLGRMVRRPDDFLGKRSLSRPDTVRPDRRQLVGLTADDADLVLTPGAQVLDQPEIRTSAGHVSSAYWSPNCRRGIAMALVERGRERHGELVWVADGDGVVAARIGPPRFLDRRPGGGLG